MSRGGATLLLIVAVAFVPSKVSCKTRIMIGVLHASIHLASALILMLLFEVGIEFLARQKLVETSGQFSFSLSICVTSNECFLASNCCILYGNHLSKGKIYPLRVYVFSPS